MATWVQATDDNLPEHDRSVPLLVNGDYDFGWCDHSLKRFHTHSEGEQPFRNVKWLSESTPGNPEIDSCIESLQELYEKIQHPDYESVDEVALLDAIELLKKFRYQSIPSSIVRRLEEMNPYPDIEDLPFEPASAKTGYNFCVSKLKELLSAQPAEQGDWIELKKDCLMPDYDEYVLWYREDGLIVYEHLDKDGNQWLYDSKIPYTHWRRIKSPVKEEKK